MAAQVPWFVWWTVLGVDVALVAALAGMAGRQGASALRVALALGAWLALAAALSAAGVFASEPGRPPAIALGVVPPIVAGAIVLASSRRARERVAAVPPEWLVGVQALRLVGLVFIAMLSRGVLPARFALPAGWGDVAVGAAAIVVAAALASRRRWARPAAVAWNAAGLLDLAVAVGVGTALSAQGTTIPSTGAMAVLPLSLVPVFGVPIFVLLHLASLIGLRARARSGAGEPGPRPGTWPVPTRRSAAPRSAPASR
jgi:hypothetical protein